MRGESEPTRDTKNPQGKNHWGTHATIAGASWCRGQLVQGPAGAGIAGAGASAVVQGDQLEVQGRLLQCGVPGRSFTAVVLAMANALCESSEKQETALSWDVLDPEARPHDSYNCSLYAGFA